MSWGLGAIVGKFLPPHRGHHFLIDTAQAQCRRLVVFVCERPDDPIPGALRVSWLGERHPEAEIRLIDDRYDAEDSRLWADNLRQWLGTAPEAVFTSEDYGEAFARHLGAHHVCVDRERLTFPCSGRAIRRDPYAAWDFLEDPVRAWYARRVVVVGAESTGTTTLSRALAAVLNTSWVGEYGREYTRRRDPARPWTEQEFVDIAIEQTRRENLAARRANRIVICDTDAFATRIWCRRYLGHENAEVAWIAGLRRVDLYLLTGDEIPFVQDGIRDGEHIRHEMHGWFEQALAAQSVPWRLLRGSPSTRVASALTEIGALFRQSAWQPRGGKPHAST